MTILFLATVPEDGLVICLEIWLYFSRWPCVLNHKTQSTVLCPNPQDYFPTHQPTIESLDSLFIEREMCCKCGPPRTDIRLPVPPSTETLLQIAAEPFCSQEVNWKLRAVGNGLPIVSASTRKKTSKELLQRDDCACNLSSTPRR